ncbi:MAG: ABC transporter permease, partial [Gammaproteobacteria bacterium]|nr:ABC transporter permease [Gammaproteobacteria bacterium]
MTTYFIRRFLLIIPTFLGVTILVFTLTRLVPGGPIERMLNELQTMGSDGAGSVESDLGGQGGSMLSDEQLEQMKEYYGFDKNIFHSYVNWLGNICRFNLGTSTRYNKPVWEIIRSRLPISLFYGIATLILTYGVCIPLGIVKAIKHRTVFDNVSSALVFFGYAIPSYVVAVALMTVFAS